MWPYEWWGPFPWMMIFPLIFFVVMLVFMLRGGGMMMHGHHGMHHRAESARDILDRRYARGEITREQYQQMKKDLD
jgi:putative membrane protein